MQKLFVDFVPQETVVLNEEQSRHVCKSLRMRSGDMLTLTCGDGQNYGCIIEDDSMPVTLKVCYKHGQQRAKCQGDAFSGVPKGDKMEDIIQKCTELGITAVKPVLTHRSVSRPDEKSAKKSQARYSRIALEAAQQSGRGIVPEICGMETLSNAVKNDDSELKILFYEGGGEPLSRIIPKDVGSVSVYIGPEGGFEKEEVELITQHGGVVATLGKRILRTQTAPVAALTAIMLLTGNLE